MHFALMNRKWGLTSSPCEGCWIRQNNATLASDNVRVEVKAGIGKSKQSEAKEKKTLLLSILKLLYFTKVNNQKIMIVEQV